MTDRLSKPEQGQTIPLFSVINGRTVAAKVAPSCGDKHGGHWYCATHKEHFDNQFSKDVHIHDEDVSHLLAWICDTHGPEVP